jgi:hypothetical protein
MMVIDDSQVLEEISEAFSAYEAALVSNDINALDTLFWNDPRTLRLGATENLFGYANIQTFRAARSPLNLARTVEERSVTSFGKQFATTAIVFTRTGEPRIGRQTQAWIRFDEGWRVVSAHVSWMDD